ncbi:hypothetical protein HK098_006213 [Nowakowskiella sp. JEL0407]|nr:hypothetical protein HK098_006213 [Nowakowskiella sp. JEL0407]
MSKGDISFYAAYRVFALEVLPYFPKHTLPKSSLCLNQVTASRISKANSGNQLNELPKPIPHSNVVDGGGFKAVLNSIIEMSLHSEAEATPALLEIKNPLHYPSRAGFRLPREDLPDSLVPMAKEIYRIFLAPNSEFELNLTSNRLCEVC